MVDILAFRNFRDGDKIELTLNDNEGTVFQTIFNNSNVDFTWISYSTGIFSIPINRIESARLLFRPKRTRTLTVGSILTPDFDYSKLLNGTVLCRFPGSAMGGANTFQMWIKCCDYRANYHFFQNMCYAERRHKNFSTEMYIVGLPPYMSEFNIEED